MDVARFLRVNPEKGLFFFDGRFRPVPLTQVFVGVKASNKLQQLRDMESICYDKVLENVQRGYQVMANSNFSMFLELGVCRLCLEICPLRYTTALRKIDQLCLETGIKTLIIDF